jgi:hypothetical protein
LTALLLRALTIDHTQQPPKQLELPSALRVMPGAHKDIVT